MPLLSHSTTTVVRAYFAANRYHLAESTRQGQKYVFSALARRTSDKRFAQLTSADLKDFILFKDDGTERADSTKKTYRATVKALFDWAADPDDEDQAPFITVNPAARLSKKVRLPKKPATVRPHTWLSEAQVEALLCAPGSEAAAERDRMVLTVMLYTGRRVTETLAVSWDKVSFDHQARSGVIYVLGKGSKDHYVPMMEGLYEALVEWRAVAVAALGRDDLAGVPVFPRANTVPVNVVREEGRIVKAAYQTTLDWSAPIASRTASSLVKKYGRAIGAPTLAPHDLRRTFAGLMEVKGASMEEIRDFLGHSSVEVTRVYLEGNPHRRRAVINRFSFGRRAQETEAA